MEKQILDEWYDLIAIKFLPWYKKQYFDDSYGQFSLSKPQNLYVCRMEMYHKV